ncbi:AAA ATPase central domain protein [Emticicia oligotrophica DSM 17448]|uniref:AAA ATPase central domain protein n=2 Tax=Emticicia TaxID=312278 RepID=A0ABM5MYR1_EMTOG|nr:AAA ATPase central domain protein [Emticicia oligotrophica DSM 17448]
MVKKRNRFQQRITYLYRKDFIQNMPSYHQIKRQIDLNPFAELMLRNELKALPSIIHENEYIDASVHGYWNTRHVLLLATTERILLVDSDAYGDIEVVEFPYDKSVTVRCPTPDSVVFGTEGRKVKVDNTLEEYISTFYEVVKARLAGEKPKLYREHDIYAEENPHVENAGNPFHVILRGLDGLSKMISQPNQQVEQPTNNTGFQTTNQVKEVPAKSLEELLVELNALIGLENVKEEVNSLVNVLKIEKIRKEQGLQLPERSLHMVFYGNPGTGKTTIARLLAQIFKTLGILNKGTLYETDRSGLVAGYTGQTSLKTREVCQKALGGILFIDEAYALNTDDTYGPEAVNTIVKFMEDNRDDFVVIVAGYEEKMTAFINSNPGLHSRFNKYIAFKDYTPEELLDIYLLQTQKVQLKVEEAAQKKVYKLFKALYEDRDASFGNGRLARNIFEKTYEKQANRLVNEGIEKNDISLVKEEDIPEIEE